MDSSTVTIEQADINRLSEKDKAELRQFIGNEEQRKRIQSQTHAVTEICWKKCITGSIKSGGLDKNEESCMVNCVDRFLDVSFLTMKHLAGMRN